MRTTFLLLFIATICGAQAPFTLNGGGTDQAQYFAALPYESINEKIIIKARINDKTYRFLLDTGAPTTISTQLSETLKPALVAQIPVWDVNNARDSMMVVSLNEIFVGDIAFKNIPALVAKPNIAFECFELDGIIGSNLMRNSILQIDERNKQMVLTDDVKRLNLSAKQASKLWLDRQSSPIIQIKLKNKNQAKEQLLFDTGMQGLYDVSMRHLATFQKHKLFETLGKGVGSNAMGLHGMAKDTTIYRLRLPVMEINGHKLLNIVTETTLDDNSRIGASLLQYGVVTVDYKHKKFYFSPYTLTDTDTREKRFPINIVPKGDQIFIGTVWSDALSSKISAGDQVIAIDGVNYEKTDLCALFLAPILKGKDSMRISTKNREGKIVETFLRRE